MKGGVNEGKKYGKVDEMKRKKKGCLNEGITERDHIGIMK